MTVLFSAPSRQVPTAGTHIARSKVLLFRPCKTGGGTEVFLFRRRAKRIWKLPGGHVEAKELADEVSAGRRLVLVAVETGGRAACVFVGGRGQGT
jgi:8-oxo-dGTP pyrophosphatase MutT (NUDIX family)